MFNKNFQKKNEYDSVKEAQRGVGSEPRGILLTGTLLFRILNTILNWGKKEFFMMNTYKTLLKGCTINN